MTFYQISSERRALTLLLLSGVLEGTSIVPSLGPVLMHMLHCFLPPVTDPPASATATFDSSTELLSSAQADFLAASVQLILVMSQHARSLAILLQVTPAAATEVQIERHFTTIRSEKDVPVPEALLTTFDW